MGSRLPQIHPSSKNKMPSLLNMLQAMPPAQQIGIPLAGFCGVAFMMSAVQAMGANVPSTISNKEWPVATKAYIKFQNMNPVCFFLVEPTRHFTLLPIYFSFLSICDISARFFLFSFLNCSPCLQC